MNRLVFSTARSTAKSSLHSASKRYASSNAAAGQGAAASSNLATYLLGAGVIGAGGYYYLQKQSPQTIQKAEQKLDQGLAKVSQAASGAAAGAGQAASAAAAGAASGALDPTKFVNFKLKAVEPYNHNTSRFIFELPEGQDSGLTVASALLMKPVVEGKGLDGKGKPAIRPYTPVTMPSEKGHMDFLIKKYPGGALTTYIHEMKPGEELAFKGPLPKHQWKANEFEHVGLIAGGTGITPMYQLIQAIDANPQDKTKVTLLFSNVTEKDILLKEAFDDIVSRKPEQFKVQHVIEKPGKGWKGLSGFVGHDELAQNLPLPGLAEKVKIFVCGPPPMVEAISGGKTSPKDQGPLKGYLADIGYSPSQVYKF